MPTLPEIPLWVDGVYQLSVETPVLGAQEGVPGSGPSNLQAEQLANRTVWLKLQIESASDYREYTFLKTESDPDGTITGLANTPNHKIFRVLEGPEDLNAFTYYLNNDGVAVKQSTLASSNYVVFLNDILNDERSERRSLVDRLRIPGYLALVNDANGRIPWGIDDIDGSPTDYTIYLWMKKMAETKSLPEFRNIPGYGLAYVMPDADGNQRLTELALSDENGEFKDWVLKRWAPRLAPMIAEEIVIPDRRPTLAGTWLHPSGDYVPYVTDLRTIVGVGSSSTNRSNSTYNSMAIAFGSAYVNMGVEGGIIAQNAAHIGAVPALITVSGGVIPASGGVAVTASNIPSGGINMAMGGTLGGVAGSIAWSNGNTGTFTRSASGAAVAVPPNTPFIPNSARYRANQIILESGKNDINQGRDAALILSMTHQIVEWIAPFLSTTIVMGHFNNHNYSDTAKARLATVNSGIVSAYGDRAIDQQAWLVSESIWDQLATEGITPTSQDLADQGNGLPPTQLMIAAKDHLTAAAYGYRMKYLVKPKLIELGLYTGD